MKVFFGHCLLFLSFSSVSFVFFNHRTELKMSGNRFSSESKNKRRSSGQRYNSEHLQASVKHSESSVLVCDAFQLLVLGIFFLNDGVTNADFDTNHMSGLATLARC